tara:strand:+ start:279 stop:512 length:234 start_codon:yes stop_codon:yes gene_type:complete
MGKVKQEIMEQDIKTWNIIEEQMKESESLSEAIDRVDRLMIQGVIALPLDCDTWHELIDQMYEHWHEMWSKYTSWPT